MKKVVFVFLLVFIGNGLFAQATDAQISQAATILGVPFNDLKQFVQSYQKQSVPSGAIEITAKELLEAFRGNQLQADNRYKGKTVNVTGKVDSVKKSYEGKYYIVLERTDAFFTIDAYVQDSQLNRIANLTKGQTITVVGQCDGYETASVRIINSIVQN